MLKTGKIVLYLFCFLGQIHSQNYTGEWLEEKKKEYFEKRESYSPIYSGKEQTKYPNYYQGDPYLINKDYQRGTLWYDGRVYTGVMLRVDLYKNQLVTLTPDGLYHIIIQNDKVEKIHLNESNIIYNYPTSPILTNLPEGFYINLYDGSYSVWETQSCALNEKIENDRLSYRFVKRNRYYVYKDEKYHPVNNKNALLKLFDSKKRDLAQFMKQEYLNFNLNPGETIVKVVIQYENLNQ